MRSTPVHPGLLAIVLLASAFNSSPTEPSAPSVGFNAMSLTLCDGGAKVFFQLSGSSHGPSIYWTASGSWNVTITESGPGCACPVGGGVARFTLG
jgi:hypothetical protein